MSEANWDINVGSAEQGDIDRGVTAGLPPPNGGATFLHGHHAITSLAGGFGRYVNDTAGGTFSPMPLGGIVEGAITRLGGGPDYTIFVYHLLQGMNIANEGYMLGLSPGGKLILRKGALIDGFPEETIDPPVNGVLAISTQTFPVNKWLQVQLGVLVQPWDDVDLFVKASDPDVNPVTSPDFQPVSGMDAADPVEGKAFVDDALGINSGSQPFIANGRAGWGFVHNAQGSRAGIDHARVGKQL